MRITLLIAVVIVALVCSCQSRNETAAKAPGGKKMEIKVTSSAFTEGGMIPKKYTCDDEDASPPLAFDGLPGEAQSIALIMDDPDAPMKTFVHWVLYNLPKDTRELPENMSRDSKLPNGAEQGINSLRKTGYTGPCPPSGTHRYFFKVYALDKKLDLPPSEGKDKLLEAMDGHILAEGQLMGRYARQ